MQFEGSVIKEQGVTFALLVVEENVLDRPSDRDNAIKSGTLFFGCPTVLVGNRRHRTFGRPDIVRFLSGVNLRQIPWQRYTVSG